MSSFSPKLASQHPASSATRRNYTFHARRVSDELQKLLNDDDDDQDKTPCPRVCLVNPSPPSPQYESSSCGSAVTSRRRHSPFNTTTSSSAIPPTQRNYDGKEEEEEEVEAPITPANRKRRAGAAFCPGSGPAFFQQQNSLIKRIKSNRCHFCRKRLESQQIEGGLLRCIECSKCEKCDKPLESQQILSGDRLCMFCSTRKKCKTCPREDHFSEFVPCAKCSGFVCSDCYTNSVRVHTSSDGLTSPSSSEDDETDRPPHRGHVFRRRHGCHKPHWCVCMSCMVSWND